MASVYPVSLAGTTNASALPRAKFSDVTGTQSARWAWVSRTFRGPAAGSGP